MVVLMLEKVPTRLRGELTRWMLEPRTGVFVGTVSAMVREKLWAKVVAQSGEGAAMLIHRAQNEQGFAIRVHGDTKREVWESEGLYLIRSPSSG